MIRLMPPWKNMEHPTDLRAPNHRVVQSSYTIQKQALLGSLQEQLDDVYWSPLIQRHSLQLCTTEMGQERAPQRMASIELCTTLFTFLIVNSQEQLITLVKSPSARICKFLSTASSYAIKYRVKSIFAGCDDLGARCLLPFQRSTKYLAQESENRCCSTAEAGKELVQVTQSDILGVKKSRPSGGTKGTRTVTRRCA